MTIETPPTRSATTPPTPAANKPLTDRHLWQITPVRDLCIVAVVVVLAVLAYSIRSVTVPILIGLGLAYICNPLVSLLQTRWRWPRWLSTAGIMVMGLLAMVAVLLTVLPRMIRQTGALITDLTQFLTDNWPRLAPYWDTLTERLVALQDASEQEQAEAIKPLLEQLQQIDFATIGRFLLSGLDVGVGMVGSAFSLTTFLAIAGLIIGFCFFFFSWRFPGITAWLKPLIPQSQRDKALHVISQMDRSVAAFIRGRLIQAGAMALILCVGWGITGVPYWLLLGMLCGILNLIPFAAGLGYLLAVGLAVMHAWGAQADFQAVEQAGDAITAGFPWGAIIWPTVVYGIAQALDSWVIEPIVQGSATGLDPLTVLLAVIVGGALAGLFGMLLAIPVAACLKILLREVVLPHVRTYAAEH